MDVRCTKCGIEYEFDDAKVTAAGVTVKCTSCGHVFKVKREEPSVVPASPSTSFGQTSNPPGMAPHLPSKGDGAEWMVKRIDGQVFRFKELTTLQKWIVERKVGRDDEISKTGKTWKRLGEIAELASFFQVVDAANAAGAVLSSPPSSTSQTLPWTTVPAPGPAPEPRPMTQPMPSMSRPPTTIPPVPAAVASANIHGDASPQALSAPTVPVRTREPARPTGDVDLGALDDDDPVLQMINRRRRNAALTVLVLVLVAAGIGAAAFWPQVSTALGIAKPVEVARPAVDDGLRALREDRLDGLRVARSALATPTDPVEAAAQVRVDVAIASHLRAHARALTALADPASVTAAKAKQEEAAASLATAYATLTKVRAEAPQLVDLHLASAAYQLEKGALAEQRADLENARAVADAPGFDKSMASAIDAEIAMEQALADAATGLDGDEAAATAALARVPAGSDDGRLRYARAALSVAALPKTASEPDVLSARAAVQAIPVPDERRDLLSRLIDAKVAKVAVVAVPVAVVDAGVSVVDAGVASAATDTKADENLEGASYDVVMQKAERARVNEKSRAAYDLFVRATKLKPSAPRPWLGVGWAAMDLGRNTEAIRAFQKALGLDDDLADAQFGLAEALKFAGRTDEAKGAYEAYLQMDPNGRDASVAKRALESLQ